MTFVIYLKAIRKPPISKESEELVAVLKLACAFVADNFRLHLLCLGWYYMNFYKLLQEPFCMQ